MRFTSRGVSLQATIASLALVLIGMLSGTGSSPASTDSQPRAELHPSFEAIFAQSNLPVKTWVFFRDKGIAGEKDRNTALREVENTCLPRTIERRKQRGTRPTLFDETDLPVAEQYIRIVTSTGAKLHVESLAMDERNPDAQGDLRPELPNIHQRGVEPVLKQG